MQLATRGLPFQVPKYSLTGDVLSYKTCGLQYRYYNGSSLPPSRPVQMWTGEFVHGVMEEAFRYWKEIVDRSQTPPPFPWPFNQTPWPPPQTPQNRVPYDIGVFGDRVEEKLKANGKLPRSTAARNAAYKRVAKALEILAPSLFPLIDVIEERINGTRDMPPIQSLLANAQRGDRYELTGIVDVISSVSLTKDYNNPIVQLISKKIQNLSGDFEIIVDYKAGRRPPITPQQGSTPYWDMQSWQIQTYSWLRGQQPGARPIKAGILIYVNELSPSQGDLEQLKSEIHQGKTDVTPAIGSSDYYALYQWQKGSNLPQFTDKFLLERCIRVVDVSLVNINNAVTQIDNIVGQIEQCAVNENTSGQIPGNWPTTGDHNDCDPCDFRRFCPSPASKRGQTGTIIAKPPFAPG